jgi:hypothetical protein
MVGLTYNDHFINRLLEKVDQYKDVEKCWTWKTIEGKYHPLIWYNNGMHRAHKIFFEYLHGTIPKEAQLRHTCRNILCINPCHMEVKKKGELIIQHNIERPRREKCGRGHMMTEENTYIWIKKSGFEDRRCRTCNNIHQKRYMERKRLLERIKE